MDTVTMVTVIMVTVTMDTATTILGTDSHELSHNYEHSLVHEGGCTN